jgi:hypothetical protein
MTTTDMDLRRTRAAKNQSVFRDVNERIEDISEHLDLAASALDFSVNAHTRPATNA